MYNLKDKRNMGPRTLKNAAIALVALGFIGAIAAMSTNAAYSAIPSASQANSGNRQVSLTAPQVIHALHSDVSQPLRSIRPVLSPPGGQHRIAIREIENEVPKVKNPQPGFAALDTVVQRTFGALAMPTPSLTFEGYDQQDNYNINHGLGGVPPDTEGDVGPNHYVQWVNTGIKMFDKNGNLLLGPILGNSLWSGFTGTCMADNNGDPVALYDPIADRWLLSQFSIPNMNTGPTYECIAISTSPDPTGSYYRYEFQTSATNFEDYPHFGVWPDAYYMTTNEFNSPVTLVGAGNFAFERAKMLVGDSSATMQYFHLDATHSGLLPTDFDGTMLPPVGSPNYIMQKDDNAPQDQLEIFRFHVDFANPSNSTFMGPTTLATAPFDSQLCTASRGACIPQPGTTELLEGLNDRLMHRIAYRNFGDHEAVVLNHTVDADGTGLAGIRWYELRGLSGTPTIYQQGTYSPDSTNRWMGSIALDGSGNIALGYSVSSSSVFPGIRYTGRLVTDPLGQLPQGEATLMAGNGSQTGYTRWGDYSMLAVDPADDCTFWYTNEYYGATSSGDWQTRIGRFKFPGCAPAPTATGTPPTATPTPTFIPTSTPTPLGCGQSVPLVEGFESGTLGTFTQTTFFGSTHWTAQQGTSNTGRWAAFAPNPGELSDQQLILSNPVAIPTTAAQATLHFSHRYSFENTTDPYDGGVMELSTDGGTTWNDAGANITQGGYTGVITATGGNPFAGRAAWTNQSPGYPSFTDATVDLSSFRGQSVKVRYRLGSDLNTGAPGWWIDDVYVLVSETCPATFTPTPTNTPGPSMLVGHVTWQGRPTQPNSLQQLPITLTLKSGTTEANYPSQNTDASGRFTVTTGLPNGTYTYRVKDPKYLANSGSLTLVSGSNNQEMGLMHAGDCNDDNVVTVVDFNIMKATFGRTVGEPGYDDRADFNGDQVINVIDFNLMKLNFGTSGAPPISPLGR